MKLFTLTKHAVFSTMIGTLACGSVLSTNAFADELKETVTTSAGRSLSPTQEAELSRSAVRVMRYIAYARSDIAKKNTKAAKANVALAQMLIDDIRMNMPTTIVKDRIKIAKEHLKYESVEEVAADLIPIEASLTVIEDYVPVSVSKGHIRKAGKHLKKGDKKSASEELEAAEVALVYTEVDLPLSSTEGHINDALEALNKKKLSQADKALAEAEGGVIFLADVIEAPVTQAKHHIWQATKYYSAKEYGKARRELDKASVLLARAAKSSDDKTSKEASKLKSDVDSLGRKLDSGAHSELSGIKGVLHRSRALADREAEKVSVGWKNHKENKALKSDFIDAKLHLNKAMSYAEAAGNTSTTTLTKEVETELDQAKVYLDRAATSTDKGVANMAKKWSADLKNARARLKNGEKESLTDYQNIISELRSEIHKL